MKLVGRSIAMLCAVVVAVLLGYQITQVSPKTLETLTHSITSPASSHNTQIFDFGSVRAGEVIEHSFHIENLGSTSLSIVTLNSTCGCTVADLERNTIGPRKTVNMPVTLSTKGKSGRISQSVVVQFSDGTTRTYTLSGFVTNYDIAKLRFGKVLRGEAWHREVSLPWPPGVELAITSVEYDVAKIDVRHTAQERRSVFQVSLSEQIPYGFLDETIRIQTNDPLAPEKSISVSGMIAYPVECQPEQVTLGLVKLGQSAEGKVRVYSPYGRPLEISGIELKEGLSVSWTENRKSASEIELAIALSADISRAYYKSVLHVKARSEVDSHEFDVEIFGVGSADVEVPEAGSSTEMVEPFLRQEE